jgi:CheY-like chemotaxis protein
MSEARQSVILNVNDDDTTRYIVTRMLTRAGFKVEEAVNGLDAVRRAQSNPALIVLDVKLPDIDGY